MVPKSLLALITVVAILIFSFYLSTQNSKHRNNQTVVLENDATHKGNYAKDYSLKQKLLNDFEIAFLKQYTPIVGCEVLDIEMMSEKCKTHMELAKADYKQQFIKNRGLPKNTFEELKLSFIE